jgi:hypothetical protein
MTQDEMWQNKERDSTCTEDQKSVPQLTSEALMRSQTDFLEDSSLVRKFWK